jgi:hypothetical protein
LAFCRRETNVRAESLPRMRASFTTTRAIVFTAAEKTELWDRWKRGMSLKAIGRAFGKQSSAIYCTVAMLAFFAISGLLFDLDQRFRCAHA